MSTTTALALPAPRPVRLPYKPPPTTCTDGGGSQPLCAEIDPELFFPPPGGEVATAKRICGMCSMRAACLDYAVTHAIEHGVWGGTVPEERQQLILARETGRPIEDGPIWSEAELELGAAEAERLIRAGGRSAKRISEMLGLPLWRVERWATRIRRHANVVAASRGAA